MVIKKSLDEIQDYLKDASNMKGIAEKVLIPETTDELKDIIINCNNNNTKLTIAGGGTGITGSRVPYEGIVVSIEKLNRILNIDLVNNIVYIEPGMRLNDLQQYLKEKGYFLPPNPTENWSMIGGNVATNASGARSFKYGSFRNYVYFLKLILSNGEIVNLERGNIKEHNSKLNITTPTNNYILQIPKYHRPLLKDASGYFLETGMDLIDLFIGSEGTLGVFAEIGLKILILPEATFSVIVFFENSNDMLDFVDYQKNKKVFEPSMIEYFDTNSLEILRPFYSQIPDESKYAIWLEFETNLKDFDKHIEDVYNEITEFTTLSETTWFAQNDKEYKTFSDFRHKLPLEINEKITKNNSIKIGTDTAIPKQHFKEYFEYLYHTLEKSSIEYLVFGHIGDCHLHANIISKSEFEYRKAKIVYNELMLKAMELGGTLSAEHGIGKIKKEIFEKLSNQELLKCSKEIKKLLDPNYILNKGNIFDI